MNIQQESIDNLLKLVSAASIAGIEKMVIEKDVIRRSR